MAGQSFWRCDSCGSPNPMVGYLTNCVGCGAPRPKLVDPMGSRPNVTVPPAKEKRRNEPIREPRTLWIGLAMMAVLTIGALGLIKAAGSSSWMVLSLILMPRWLFLAPMGLIALGIVWKSWRSVRLWGAFAAVLLLILGPWMGWNVPWTRITGATPAGTPIRILSYNQGSQTIDGPRFLGYLERQRIEIVFFQEQGRNPLLDQHFGQGWYSDKAGTIYSKFPIVEEIPPPPEDNRDQGRYTFRLYRVKVRHPTAGDFLIANLHLPTLRPGFKALYAGDLGGLKTHMQWWAQETERCFAAMAETKEIPILAAGDFNMSMDHDLMKVLSRAYHSAYEESGWGYGYTRPSEMPWVRIDHIVGTDEFGFNVTWIGPDFGSDHLPIVSEVTLAPRPSAPPPR